MTANSLLILLQADLMGIDVGKGSLMGIDVGKGSFTLSLHDS